MPEADRVRGVRGGPETKRRKGISELTKKRAAIVAKAGGAHSDFSGAIIAAGNALEAREAAFREAWATDAALSALGAPAPSLSLPALSLEASEAARQILSTLREGIAAVSPFNNLTLARAAATRGL
jgi:hypothetical protein